MNFEYDTDDQIEADLYRDVRTELDVLPRILYRLREVEIRKIYSKHGLSSLEEYSVKKLGYTEDEGARRISAMRLLRELPQLEKKVEEGKLKLTHLVRARTVFRKEARANRERTKEQKLSLLERLEDTTLREAERTLEREAFVDISKPKNELSLDQFDGKIRANLVRLLELRGSGSGWDGVVLCDLIGQLTELGLDKWDPVRKAEKAKRKEVLKSETALAKTEESPCLGQSIKRAEIADEKGADSIDTMQPAAPRVKNTFVKHQREYIPAARRHAVYLRARGQCEKCGSGRHCQVDHIIPVAKGGSNDIGNLRLLCRACNLRRAIDDYGLPKMRQYLRTPYRSYHFLA